jgi:hypothetical protein
MTERVAKTQTFTCGFCEKPFTLNPNDNHYTAAEWAADGHSGSPGEPTERSSA